MMALREDLISSAITFLQDPSVANAPLDKKIAFLQSKNLTQEEVDAALARTGTDGYLAQQPTPQSQALARQPYPAGPGAQQYPYGPYQGPGFWQQPPPPEVPRRDWRDYFIMATVLSGLGYGAYFLAKRYVVPLIAPPTPPQLEQDKASVDASFERAFALIDQLTADTASIKAAEDSRKERLDSALGDVETALSELKASSRRRDDDSHRINEEVRNLQNMIPKAMKAQEESTDARLKELNNELKSLKTLIANRVAAPSASNPVSNGPSVRYNGVSDPSNDSTGARVNSIDTNTVNGQSVYSGAGVTATPTTATPTSPLGNGASSQYSQASKYGSGKGGIPAWQMAASKKTTADEAKPVTPADSGTAVTEIENA